MKTFLLDANVLIALTIAEHEHHERASDWLASIDQFAVCPIVEGALMRFLVRLGETPATAMAVLAGVRESGRCTFWPATLSYIDVDTTSIDGHRQLTDSYLACLADHNSGTLATFDRGLATRHPEYCFLIP